VPRDVLKVLIRTEKHQAVPDTQLRYQGIDSASLYPGAAARIPQRCRLDMVVPIRNQEGHCRKPL
jgi:hypothetical protein